MFGFGFSECFFHPSIEARNMVDPASIIGQLMHIPLLSDA
jgi:hypothetical protein